MPAPVRGLREGGRHAAAMKQERAEPKSEQDQAKDLERRHGRSARERERIVGSRDL